MLKHWEGCFVNRIQKTKKDLFHCNWLYKIKQVKTHSNPNELKLEMNVKLSAHKLDVLAVTLDCLLVQASITATFSPEVRTAKWKLTQKRALHWRAWKNKSICPDPFWLSFILSFVPSIWLDIFLSFHLWKSAPQIGVLRFIFCICIVPIRIDSLRVFGELCRRELDVATE